MKSFKQSAKLFSKAKEIMVGGVNSPVRAFDSVGGEPIFIKKGRGTKIIDVDGNRYIDFVLSYGPLVLGHRPLKVDKILRNEMRNGYAFGATTGNEIILSSLIVSAFESMDKIRFVNSGTEAVLSAIRLARAFTKKTKIVKFSGCYHGHMDDLLVSSGSGLATLNMPSSMGVTQESISNTLVVDFNDIDEIKKTFQENKDIAAVIIEPIAGNMGVVLPKDGFLKKLQTVCYENNSLLIVDEVMTGFRSCFGGAQKILGIEADITVLGKVIGGGFPIGAYGARKEIMDMIAPLGSVYQAGTFSGNPISMTAGIETLKILKKKKPYKNFQKLSTQLEKDFLLMAKSNGISLQVNSFYSMISLFFNDKKVYDYSTVIKSDKNLYSKFFWLMIEEGIYIPPSAFESWFLSTAFRKIDYTRTISAFDKVLSQLKK